MDDGVYPNVGMENNNSVQPRLRLRSSTEEENTICTLRTETPTLREVRFDGTKVETTRHFATNEAGYESCRVLAKVSGEADTESSTEFLESILFALLRS